MKVFVLAVLVVGLVAGQDQDVPSGRTRICKEGEFPGKRVKRALNSPEGLDEAAGGGLGGLLTQSSQEAAQPRQPPAESAQPCWFVPNDSFQTGEDCQKAFESGTKCESSQVFVKLGQLKVCIKFEAADKWFLSEGTNGYCGTNECCEWYPKETSKVVFCTPSRPFLKWFPKNDASCDDATAQASATVGVEIIQGVSGDTKTICIAKQDTETTGSPLYHQVDVRLTPKCGGGCCIFEFTDPPAQN